MLLSQYCLQDGSTRLRSYEKQLRTPNDLELSKTKIYGVVYDMATAAEEIYFCTYNMSYRDMRMDLIKSITELRDTEDVETAKQNLNSLLDKHFYEGRDFFSMTMSDFRPSAYQALTKYTPTLDFNVQALSNCITLPDNGRNINFIDPRCRNGSNLRVIKERIPTAKTYGIELEPGTAERAKQHVDHIAMGNLIGSRISNDAFDCMYVEPPISWMFNSTSTLFAKQEKTFMHSIWKYVRPEGVIMIVIPYFRLYKDMCLMFSKYLDNIQVRKLADRDFNDKGLIAIIGTRSVKKESNEESYRMLRRIFDIDSIDNLFNKELDPYLLSEDIIPIEVFRGSILDMDEMDNIVQTSGAMDAFWNSQDVEKINENAKQPLLPFNIGQIGLVLTSGCLDGIVDEGDGNYHVIKGKVSKKSNVERDLTENNNIEINETISNRVEINVMMPNGEFKVLA